ncbi:hypothetical protein [Anaerorhabdus sp.]
MFLVIALFLLTMTTLLLYPLWLIEEGCSFIGNNASAILPRKGVIIPKINVMISSIDIKIPITIYVYIHKYIKGEKKNETI